MLRVRTRGSFSLQLSKCVHSQATGKRQQGGAKTPLTSPAPLTKASNVASENTVVVNCKVNGYQINALVDTGASVSILHENFFKLGVNFLEPHGCVVDFAAENIEFYGEKLTCRPLQVVNRITVAESCVIPARSMINVSCIDGGTIDNDMLGVLEPKERFEESHKTGIIKVVATITNGRIPVRMFNPSDSAKRIYRGSNVGVLHPVAIQDETKTCASESCFRLRNERGRRRKLFPIRNPDLSKEDIDNVHKVLIKHHRAVSLGKHDLGDVSNFSHEINTGDASPIDVPLRRVPFHKRQAVQDGIESMLKDDVIEPSNSPW